LAKDALRNESNKDGGMAVVTAWRLSPCFLFEPKLSGLGKVVFVLMENAQCIRQKH
jgi:hypothetical protein